MKLSAVSNDYRIVVLRKYTGSRLELVIQHLSYNSINNDKKNNSIVLLKRKALEMENIVETAQKSKTNKSTTVIKSDAINYIQATSFSDLLSLLPGKLRFSINYYDDDDVINLRQTGGWIVIHSLV